MARTLEKAKGRKERGRYLALPVAVLDTDDYRNLSLSAKCVLTILHYQYRGHNNGDLSCPLSEAKRWGINHPRTLAKSLRELMDADLIQRTRDPRRDRNNPHGQCSLFAITWETRDDCDGKHDLGATLKPLRSFSLEKKQGNKQK